MEKKDNVFLCVKDFLLVILNSGNTLNNCSPPQKKILCEVDGNAVDCRFSHTGYSERISRAFTFSIKPKSS